MLKEQGAGEQAHPPHWPRRAPWPAAGPPRGDQCLGQAGQRLRSAEMDKKEQVTLGFVLGRDTVASPKNSQKERSRSRAQGRFPNYDSTEKPGEGEGTRPQRTSQWGCGHVQEPFPRLGNKPRGGRQFTVAHRGAESRPVTAHVAPERPPGRLRQHGVPVSAFLRLLGSHGARS